MGRDRLDKKLAYGALVAVFVVSCNSVSPTAKDKNQSALQSASGVQSCEVRTIINEQKSAPSTVSPGEEIKTADPSRTLHIKVTDGIITGSASYRPSQESSVREAYEFTCDVFRNCHGKLFDYDAQEARTERPMTFAVSSAYTNGLNGARYIMSFGSSNPKTFTVSDVTQTRASMISEGTEVTCTIP